jgi:SAM-dependent methyltransferase
VREIDRVVETYRSAFKEHGRSSAAVLCPKGRHDLRFQALLNPCAIQGRRLLDFGCGLGHLCDYLTARDIDCEYVGVDIVPDFIESNRIAFPGRRFELIKEIKDISGRFDIVLSSGVFNILYFNDVAANEEYVKTQIGQLYTLTDEVLVIDFMTSHVDFQQNDAFHADPSAMIKFAIGELSKRVLLNHSYMPFEFCMAVFKSNSIDKASSLYV